MSPSEQAPASDRPGGESPLTKEQANEPPADDANSAIDWSQPAQRVYDLVRGSNPTPGAHVNQPVTASSCEPTGSGANPSPPRWRDRGTKLSLGSRQRSIRIVQVRVRSCRFDCDDSRGDRRVRR